MLAAVIAIWILLISVLTACLYVWDKRAATKDRPRIAEKTLLTCSALGGWPGAVIAGQSIRHKTQKLSYRIRFALCVIVNIAVIAAILYASAR